LRSGGGDIPKDCLIGDAVIGINPAAPAPLVSVDPR
jgi:hypothetical protein